MRIREDNLSGDGVARLLREHLDEMRAVTPPESVHALDIDSLRSPDITFWSVWDEEELVGCGALKELDATSGEIKSMRTHPVARRRGVSSKLLEHIIEEAKRRSYVALYLETGAMPEFEPARRLYLRYGFEIGPPFGDYLDDPNSVFMSKTL